MLPDSNGVQTLGNEWSQKYIIYMGCYVTADAANMS